MFTYRVGRPLWKTAVRFGIPVKFQVRVYRDEETDSYWASSSDLDGLVVSGKTLDELREEVRGAAEVLLDMAINGSTARIRPELLFDDQYLRAA